MKHSFLSAVAAVLLFVPASVPAQAPPDSQAIVRGNAELAIDLYARFAEEHDNFIFSPYSVYTTLVMLYGGARGRTAEQVRSALRVSTGDARARAALENLQDLLSGRTAGGGVELAIANALWPQERYPLLPDYVEFVEGLGAEVVSLDYRGDPDGARSAINAWAEEQTNGKIRNLLQDPPYPTTLLYLASALYFRGDWNSQFDPSATTLQPFYCDDGRTPDVPMMYQQQRFRYSDNSFVGVLEMPYLGEELSMLVLLPIRDSELSTVEAALSADSLQEWMEYMTSPAVDLYLPAFRIKSHFDLKPTLQSMGMTDVFEAGVADLSGIDGVPEWLSVSMAIQDAFVAVGEEGSEAAAVTLGGGCFPGGTPVLTEHGAVPIERVAPGTRVFAREPGAAAWVLAPVARTTSISSDGDVVTVRAGSSEVAATGNHPFFVVAGAGLESRPPAADVPPGERRATPAGRWVAARDLEVGDALLTREGTAVITELRTRREALQVYNLVVEEIHTYAVGHQGFLVHNKGSAEEFPVEFRADHPFIFLIRDAPTGTILFMGRVRDPS